MKLKGRTVNPGEAEGVAMVTRTPFSFLGELEPLTGKVPSPSHELFGESLAGRIFVCPTGKGSSAAPSIAYTAKKAGVMPKAMILREVEPVIAAAILTADIPAIDKLDHDPLEAIETGDYVKVDATAGIIEVVKKGAS
jgi:predicted aconitase with swiveling domain